MPRGRPKKNPVASGDADAESVKEGKGKGKLIEETSTRGRKKRVWNDNTLEEPASKRVKIEALLDNSSQSKDVTVKVTARSTTRSRLPPTAPKWKVVVNAPDEEELRRRKPAALVKTLSPRIWTGSREELLALLPELAGNKCFNGISWYKYPTPLVVLDDTNRCFEIECQEGRPLCLDLVTTRSFVCAIPTTSTQSSQVLHTIVPPPNNPGIDPQHTSAKTVVRRKAARYKIPKGVLMTQTDTVPPPFFSSTESSTPGIGAQSPPAIDPGPSTATSTHSVLAQSSVLLSPQPVEANAGPLPPPPLLNSVPTSAGEGPISGQEPRLLPRTWNQAAFGLDQKLEATERELPVSVQGQKAVKISESSASKSRFAPPIFGMDLPQASSSQVTLDDLHPSGVPPHLPPSMPPSAPFVSAPAPTTSVHTNEISHRMSSFKLSTQTQSTPSEHASAPLMTKMRVLDLVPSAASVPPPTADHERAPVPTPGPVPIPVPVMMDESSTEMNLAFAGDLPLLLQPSTGTPTNPGTTVPPINLEGYIPSQLPDEISALIESYLFGRPLSLMGSRERLRESWAIEVKKHFGYSMLGFFRVLGVQERRVTNETVKVGKIPTGSCTGLVQWRFHLEWAPGGEEIILPDHSKEVFDQPWWRPSENPPPPALASAASAAPGGDPTTPNQPAPDPQQPDEPEERYPTTPRYREARIANHEYQFRHCPLSDAYDSIVPEQVLAPFGRQHSDRVFPRGWLCVKCGRLNFQQALRHRKCSSVVCKDHPVPVEPYYYSLYFIRDPQERLPITYPRNAYPPGTKLSEKKSGDGTQTFTYNVNGKDNIFIKHIFLSNRDALQKPASSLMEQVQLTVPLLRSMVDNGPYFHYNAEGPEDRVWRDVPNCINDAKEVIVERAASYAKILDELVSITHLKITAWITEGSKRGHEVISAKSKCAILLAMGCTTMLTVIPRSLEKTTPSSRKLEPQEDGPAEGGSGWVAVDGAVDEEPAGATGEVASSASAIVKKRRGAPRQKDRPSFTLSLYHGDMVVFYGDDFEYSFKRDGTSFMLFASHAEIV